MKYTAESDALAIELAKLEMEQKAIEKRKAAEIKAAADMVKLEKIRIDREAAAIKAAQEDAAAEAYTWMKVFTALTDRGMEANKIMDAIKAMQEQGHTAAMCLEMIEKTSIKPKAEPKKESPRPAAYGTWA